MHTSNADVESARGGALDPGPTSHATADPSSGTARTIGDAAGGLADRITSGLGSVPMLVAALVLVVAWALTGPIFGFSDTWQLFINTTTTVITFLMVFVIQNSANRQSKAVALKLDELIRAVNDARDEFVDLDHASEAEMAEHEAEFQHIAHGRKETD